MLDMRPIVALVVCSLCAGALNGCASLPKRMPAWDPPALSFQRAVANGPVCVSFSGGGMRSAAFSMGVMQGLHDAKLLDKSTIMSATSGGAYAASWLYIADRLRKIGAENALNSVGEEQARLEEQAQFFVSPSFGGFIGGTGVAFESIFGPIRKAACADETPKLWPSGGSAGYGNAIARVFYAQMSAEASLSDRRTQGAQVGLGLPIFGVSLVTGFRPSCDADYLRKDLKPAEVMDGGVRTADGQVYPIERMTFRDLVTSAGGAIDVTPAALRPAPADGELVGRGVFNLCQIPGAFRPLIGHAFCARSEGREEQVTFMTDGGFTDNLAVLPLLRRDCPVIIAADAGHDPTLDFDSLRQVEAALSAAGVDAQHIQKQIRGASTAPTTRFIADRAVAAVGGHIQSDGKAFWLVKLAVPEALGSSHLPASVVDALREASDAGFDETGCSGEGIGHRCKFPQQSTALQHYTPEQFRAYRDLGRWAVRTELIPKLVESGYLRAVE